MEGNESNKLVKGALLLTLAGLISKVLSAGYRIPLQNLTGDIGFYIYQQVYAFLAIALILSLYGFPSAISKMINELRAQGKVPSFRSFYAPVFLVLFLICGTLFLFLFFNAKETAVWAGDPNLQKTYELAAFAFLLIPFTSLLRGVSQGMLRMKPTAYSQISEQIVRVILIISAAVFIYVQSEDIYRIGQAAGLASISGALAAILILGFFFMKNKPVGHDRYDIPWSYYVKTLLTLGIVAAFNHMVLIIMQFADAFTLVPGLIEYGLSQTDAMKAKGVFDRGQPLIQLGTVLGSSFALAMIPAISRQKLKNDPNMFYVYIQSALVFSFYLAIGATLGLIIIFPEANPLLYQNGNGTSSLQVLVIAIFLSSLAITAASILQGLGYVKRTAAFIMVAFVIKWIGNQMLVPFFGITGSAVATVFSLAILAILMLFALKRKLPNLKVEKQINWRALVIAAGGMAVYLAVVDFLAEDITSRLVLLFYIIFISVTGACIYMLLLLRFKAFTESELSMLPFASILIRFHKEREKHA